MVLGPAVYRTMAIFLWLHGKRTARRLQTVYGPSSSRPGLGLESTRREKPLWHLGLMAASTFIPAIHRMWSPTEFPDTWKFINSRQTKSWKWLLYHVNNNVEFENGWESQEMRGIQTVMLASLHSLTSLSLTLIIPSSLSPSHCTTRTRGTTRLIYYAPSSCYKVQMKICRCCFCHKTVAKSINVYGVCEQMRCIFHILTCNWQCNWQSGVSINYTNKFR